MEDDKSSTSTIIGPSSSAMVGAIVQETFISEVYCTLQFEATHNWPSCPFDEVDYLRVPHRHMFHVKARKVVNHDDRDVEFIMLKNQIRKFIDGRFYKKADTNLYELGPMSCEMIARELMLEFDLSSCEVSEDDENGAILTRQTRPVKI